MKLIQEFEHYLQEDLGIQPEVHPWKKSESLPPYLRSRYHFFTMEVLGTACVLMVDTDEEQSPGVVRKHVEQVRARDGGEVIYVRPAVTSFNRRRLIGHKIPFVIPGNQMYLPMLGIDLREHMKSLRTKKPLFTPSTQVLLLHILWRKPPEPLTPTAIAHQLGYSAMSMTRAFDELEAAGLCEHDTVGKERHFRLAFKGKRLWETALPHLQTPVRRRVYVASALPRSQTTMAGQSALARYTMLAAPKVPVVALAADEWKSLRAQEEVLELAMPEPGGSEIELWKYPPAIFASEGMVDRLSLYLSMRDTTDERVQSALDQLLEGMEW